MKIQKITFVCTSIAAFFSLAASFLLFYSGCKDTIWQQLSYALFSASIMTCILSYMYYRVETRKIVNEYFYLSCFLYQKTLNINTYLSYQIKRKPIESLIEDKWIEKVADQVKRNIEESIGKLKQLEYNPILSNKASLSINDLNANLLIISSLCSDLFRTEIFIKQWELAKLEDPSFDKTKLLIEYNAHLNDLRAKCEATLVVLESVASVLATTINKKNAVWSHLKKGFFDSAKTYNNI